MLVEDIHSIAQQQVARPLQDFALVDVLFQVILRPAYLVLLLIHQFDHMKMVEDMHGVRAVFKYGGDESGREIGGDILDVELLTSDPFPKSGQSIGRLALTHMEPPLSAWSSQAIYIPPSFLPRAKRGEKPKTPPLLRRRSNLELKMTSTDE